MQVQVPWLLLLAYSAVFHVTGGQNVEWLNQGGRLCNVDELVPERHEAADQWSSRMVETPLFNCTCPFLKSRCVYVLRACVLTWLEIWGP